VRPATGRAFLKSELISSGFLFNDSQFDFAVFRFDVAGVAALQTLLIASVIINAGVFFRRPPPEKALLVF
jgi:hypothetical protein